MTPELQVVTCASHAPTQSYYCYPQFLKSLDRYGIKPVILGFGQKWGGLGSKPRLLKRAIEDGTVNADWILWCDAFDVLFADDPRKISWPDDCIIWNAEKSCFPDASLASEHPPTNTPWKYFNSGVSCGLPSAYFNALKQMHADDIPDDFVRPDGTKCEPNDQDLLMRQFLFGTWPMQLDYECHFFQTLCGVTEDELDLTGERIRNTVTGTEPIVFHLNGPKEFWLPKLLAKLNL